MRALSQMPVPGVLIAPEAVTTIAAEQATMGLAHVCTLRRANRTESIGTTRRLPIRLAVLPRANEPALAPAEAAAPPVRAACSWLTRLSTCGPPAAARPQRRGGWRRDWRLRSRTADDQVALRCA